MHLHHNKPKSQQNKRKQSYKTTQKDNNTLQTPIRDKQGLFLS